MTALLLLGLSAFLAATIIPFSSEVALAGALSTGVDPTAAVLTATIGNSLGSICTFYLGYWGKLSYLERYCRISESQILAIQSKINRYGAWAAVGCFLPLIGDGTGIFQVQSTTFHLPDDAGQTLPLPALPGSLLLQFEMFENVGAIYSIKSLLINYLRFRRHHCHHHRISRIGEQIIGGGREGHIQL
ncbi:MAG: hypothetical protein RRY34_08850, partial [Victivallaceae bacterium]